jgi:hypothetical protein
VCAFVLHYPVRIIPFHTLTYPPSPGAARF